MKFGNWENEDAFKIIKENYNDIASIYTLHDIYHLHPGKVLTESGNSVSTNSFSQLKSLFKNQLIVTIQFKNDTTWELPSYTQNNYLRKVIPRLARIHDINVSGNQMYKRHHNEDMKRRVIPQMKKSYSFENYRYPDSQDYSTCQICFDPLKGKNVGVTDKCGHMFHKECAGAHLKSKRCCPICRTSVNTFKKVASQFVPRFGKIVPRFGKKKVKETEHVIKSVVKSEPKNVNVNKNVNKNVSKKVLLTLAALSALALARQKTKKKTFTIKTTPSKKYSPVQENSSIQENSPIQEIISPLGNKDNIKSFEKYKQDYLNYNKQYKHYNSNFKKGLTVGLLDDCNALMDNVIVKHTEINNILKRLSGNTIVKDYVIGLNFAYNVLEKKIKTLIGNLNKGSSFGKRKSKKQLLLDLRKVLRV